MISSYFNVGAIPSSPQILTRTSTATSISFTWDQPEEEGVEGYEIDYKVYRDECDSESYPLFTIRLSNSSLRMYTIVNSTDTPVEDGSDYAVYLYAVNHLGRSKETTLSRVPISTFDTRKYKYNIIYEL